MSKAGLLIRVFWSNPIPDLYLIFQTRSVPGSVIKIWSDPDLGFKMFFLPADSDTAMEPPSPSRLSFCIF